MMKICSFMQDMLSFWYNPLVWADIESSKSPLYCKWIIHTAQVSGLVSCHLIEEVHKLL